MKEIQNNEQKSVRDLSIDVLRCLGLLCIMLVHILPPRFLAEFRIFDVCLMVFISASLYKPVKNIQTYYWKRICRLLIPTWIFVSVYLLYRFIMGNILMSADQLVPWELINTYLLVDVHLGPIWVIRVFLLMALVSPLLYFFSLKKIPFKIGILFLMFLLQSVLVYGVSCIDSFYVNFYLNKFVLYLFGYSFVAYAAMCIRTKNLYLLIICILASAFLLIVPQIYDSFQPCSSFKYPPRGYYLIYGVSISYILWYFRYKILKIFNNKLFVFIGQNTLWLYFYHILFVELANKFLSSWTVRFIFVVLLSVLFYSIQYFVAKRFLGKSCAKYLIG